MTPLARSLSLALAAALGLGVLASGTTQAQSSPAATPGGRAWNSLTPAQQKVLAPLERDWGGIDAARRQKWIEVAGRFPKMPADEQRRVQERMASWSRLSPQERSNARLNFQESRQQLSPDDRKARWEAYQALPPEQRRQLAAQSAAASAVPNMPKPANAGGARDAAQRTAAASPAAAAPAPAPTSKSNIVRNPALSSPAPGTPVTPTVVQARPGATTTLMSRPAEPPRHQQTGLPKIAASSGFVDSTTLLPQRGAQGAATRSANASATAASQPVRR